MSAIEISTPYTRSPNSAGGVDVFHEIYNATEKEMKYITFTYLPYNSVGDLVACSIKKTSEAICKLTGPFAPGKSTYVDWKNVWYNSTIQKVKLKEVKIQYMDDTEEIIDGESLIDIRNDPESKLGKIRAIERAEREKKEKKQKLIIGGIIAAVAILFFVAVLKASL